MSDTDFRVLNGDGAGTLRKVGLLLNTMECGPGLADDLFPYQAEFSPVKQTVVDRFLNTRLAYDPSSQVFNFATRERRAGSGCAALALNEGRSVWIDNGAVLDAMQVIKTGGRKKISLGEAHKLAKLYDIGRVYGKCFLDVLKAELSDKYIFADMNRVPSGWVYAAYRQLSQVTGDEEIGGKLFPKKAQVDGVGILGAPHIKTFTDLYLDRGIAESIYAHLVI